MQSLSCAPRSELQEGIQAVSADSAVVRFKKLAGGIVKSLLRFSLSVALCAGGLVGVQGSASALATVHATICKPYGNSNTAGLNAYVSGAFNYSGGPLVVACPVIRTTEVTEGGFSVWVDGTASTGTASCALHSYNYDGTFLGSTSFSTTGVFDKLLTLPPAQVPTYSSQAVVCTLPPNGGLFDLVPVQ
jgi:hypothetical protein